MEREASTDKVTQVEQTVMSIAKKRYYSHHPPQKKCIYISIYAHIEVTN